MSYKKQIVDGIFVRNVWYDEHLKYCYYGSCGIVNSKDCKILVSYSTPIIDLYNDGWLIVRFNPAYSRTTIKHVSAFLKEYTNLSYYMAKDLYKNDTAYNIFTGEILPVNEFFNTKAA